MTDELLELAKSLNLVEKINVGDNKKNIMQQTFKYIIVVDFEATCWENKEDKWRDPEIIEFPGVLINTTTGKIEEEFQQYVRPEENNRLSAFCTKLTGIKQQQVDRGITVDKAILDFNKWMKDIVTKNKLVLYKTTSSDINGNTALMTWSDWDFGVCLKKECSRKKIKKPTYFDQWIDLRALYREHYKYRPLNFSDALSNVGMTFIGNEHCGLDDARNIALLAHKMCEDGAQLKITKDLRAQFLYNRPAF